jgi:hypothetical protein
MSKIGEIIKNIFEFNLDYIPLQINNILSEKEKSKLKYVFKLFFNILVGVNIAIVFVATFLFYYQAFHSQSSLYYNLFSLFLTAALCFFYYKLEFHKDTQASNNVIAFLFLLFLPISIIIFFLSSLIMINLSKKIIILKKEHLGIITKVNLNLQEFDYKDGELHSYGNRPAVRKKLKNTKGVIALRDAYDGDMFYHKGNEWKIKYKDNSKFSGIDKEDFNKFKKNIDLKSKIGNF